MADNIMDLAIAEAYAACPVDEGSLLLVIEHKVCSVHGLSAQFIGRKWAENLW